ncbi:peroxiredoxin [Actinomycetospora endophytica]|uniref:thioredoxin-dependent peroxiredoxin n=1 Tax=Actinomycetospora endophytica TaxID=2291215 RepID=A0ABS8PF44_9PSEU|nr:peroxiredoxin [Actinomycetospora endophytica]MCD2196876.1 peroxiredoxin [Actinomycetospora endophytica]
MKAGDTAPDFSLADDTGTTRTLSGLLADGPVVLFFYPLASSGGCTQESCHFRDLAAEFAAVGAQRVGISADSVEKQHTFSTNNSFDYPLLSDPKGVVAKQFDAKRAWLPALPIKRKTFVIDTDRTVLEVITGEMRFDEHADSALTVLRKRAER